MRKNICFAMMLAVLTLYGAVPALAADTALGVTRIYVSGDQVSVAGKALPNRNISATANKEGDTDIDSYRLIWQTRSESDGSFSFNFGMLDADAKNNSTSGRYELYVTDRDGISYGPYYFIYSSLESRTALIGRVNAAGSAQILDSDIFSAPEDYNVLSSIGLYIDDYLQLNGGAKAEVCAAVQGKSAPYTESTLVTAFNRALAGIGVKYAESGARAGELLDKYSELTLRLVTEDNVSYGSFAGNSEIKEWIWGIVYDNRSGGTADAAEKAFREAVALYNINHATYDTIKALFARYVNTLELTAHSGYAKFLASGGTTGIPYISKRIAQDAGSKPFRTAEAVKASLDGAVASWEAYLGNQNKGQTGSTGSKNTGSTVLVEPAAPQATPEPPSVFSDVGTEHWAQTYVEYLSRKGIVGGYEDGRFVPDGEVTRKQIVKMLVLAFDLRQDGEEAAFADVPADDWAYSYVSIAKSCKVVNGVSEEMFGGEASVTREDMAVMLLRAYAASGNGVETGTRSGKFSDDGQISGYAGDAVYAMKDMGIIAGKGGGAFAPKDSLTRAEAAKMICMLMQR